MPGTLRQRRAEQRQTLRSACAQHPDKMLTTKDGEPWCYFCDAPPAALERVESETTKYLTGDPTQNAATRSKLRDKYGEMTVTNETAIVLVKPSDNDLKLAGKEFTNLVPGFGRDISDGDLMMAAQLRNVGFQHFHFTVQHGKLTLNYDGRTFWTKRAMGELDGGMDHRPMNADERLAYGLEAEEIGFIAYVHKINPGAPGGRVTWSNFGRAGGTREQNPLALPAVHKTSKGGKPYVEGGNASEMALKRAYARTMQLAAPLGVAMNTYLPGEMMNEATGEIEVIEASVLEAGDVTDADYVDRQPENPVVLDTNPFDATITPDEVNQSAETLEVTVKDKMPRKRSKVSKQLAALTVGKIKKLGVEDISAFEYEKVKGSAGVVAMLRDGHTADEVAKAVAIVCKPADDHQAKPSVKTVEDGEDVEELPW